MGPWIAFKGRSCGKHAGLRGGLERYTTGKGKQCGVEVKATLERDMIIGKRKRG